MEQETLDPRTGGTGDWPEVAEPTVPGKKVGTARAAGILLTGLVVGAIGIATIQSTSGQAPAANDRPGFGGPPGFQQGSGPGGFGGPPGAQQRPAGLSGTLVSVEARGLTISVGGASTSVPVDSATVITRNGVVGALTGLRPGDTVTVTVANGVAAQVNATSA